MRKSRRTIFLNTANNNTCTSHDQFGVRLQYVGFVIYICVCVFFRLRLHVKKASYEESRRRVYTHSRVCETTRID